MWKKEGLCPSQTMGALRPRMPGVPGPRQPSSTNRSSHRARALGQAPQGLKDSNDTNYFWFRSKKRAWGKSINYCNVRLDVSFSQRVWRRGGRRGTEQHLPLAERREEKIRIYHEGWGQFSFLDLCFMFSDYYRNRQPLYLKNQTLRNYIVTL